MKEEIFAFTGSRLVRIGWRDIGPYERDPQKVWIGDSLWYLNSDGTITHDVEQLGTINAVDPSVLLHTKLVNLGEQTPDGRLVKSPTSTWFQIGNQLEIDPTFRFEFCAEPAKLEEFLAGAYHLEGWEAVTLTPRSGDKGRDVIAEMYAQRVLEQAKAYNARRLVSQNDVRAIYGVLCLDDNATKAVITTTADFCPGVADEFMKVMPHRLETRNGEQLVNWIGSLLVPKLTASIGANSIEHSQHFACVKVDVLTCDNCGAITVDYGNCYLCHNCGNSMGCS